jgi:hypothetical protein
MHNRNLHESRLKHPAYTVSSVNQYRQAIKLAGVKPESKLKALWRRIIALF